MGVMAEIPRGTPQRDAWEEYRLTPEYANTRSWAVKQPEQSVDGSLWAAFNRGWELASKVTRANNEANGFVWLLSLIGGASLFFWVIDWAVFFIKFAMGAA